MGITHNSAGAVLTQSEFEASNSHTSDCPINKNVIINGGFRVAQRGTAFTSATTPANSDDTYLLDRWALLSDGNDVVDVSQSTTVIPTGATSSIKLEVETANKQFGIVTFIENKDALRLIGGYASLSFKARMAAADDNTHSLKALVLSWNSTADTVTSDVVSAWAASPTLAANWTAENTASSNTLTTSWQTFKIENIYIDTASAANIAIFIFCDQTDGVVDDAIYISQVQLEPGAIATTFEIRPYAQEFELCRRYCRRLDAVDNANSGFALGLVYSTSGGIFLIQLDPPMRSSPTLTASATAAHFTIRDGSHTVAASGVPTVNQVNKDVVVFTVADSTASLTDGRGAMLNASNTTAPWIQLTAEL